MTAEVLFSLKLSGNGSFIYLSSVRKKRPLESFSFKRVKTRQQNTRPVIQDGGGKHLLLRSQFDRLRAHRVGPAGLRPDALLPVDRRVLLPAQRSAGRLRRPRRPGAQPVHSVRGHDGHADGPLCHHVPAGQPVPGLPVLQLPVPAQHVCGHRQPLAAPAQLNNNGIDQPQEHRPLRQPCPPNLLHLQAGAVCDVCRERALLLPPLPPPSHPGTCSVALLAAGPLWAGLPAEDGHQPGSPGHRLPEHGRPRRRGAREEREDAVREREREGGVSCRYTVLLLLFIMGRVCALR